MAATNWTDINRSILDALDVVAEYRALGVEASGDHPSPSGWIPCKVFGSEERTPSAGINIGSEHPRRGRYKEFTGEARNLSLFEFAAATGKFATWKEARAHYAKQAGIKLPSGGQPKLPDDNLVFRDWNDALIRSWCLKKQGIAPWAVRIAGGRLAGWPAKTQDFTVVTLPVFGAQGVDDVPVGWTIWNKSGRPLPLFQGKGKPSRPVKMLTTGGSTSGWMNRFALANLEKAEVVWKVEGPADMLALQSIIPKDLIYRHVVITNSNGTMELPREDFIDPLAGKAVYVVHDCDQDGQTGGTRWARAIASVAAECRYLILPYEITEKHGKDLRDWINEGHAYAELLEMAGSAAIMEREVRGDVGSAATTSPTSMPKSETPTNDSLAAKDGMDIDRQICEAIRLDVLGETADQHIEVFSESQCKNATINDVAKLRFSNLLQMCGPILRERVHQAAEEVPGMWHFDRVREAIAVLGGRRRIAEGSTRGAGCWLGYGGEIVLVGAGEAAVWDGTTLTQVKRPRAAGLVLDISASESWYQFDRLKQWLEHCNQAWCEATVNEAIAIFEKWFWKQDLARHDGGVVPQLVVGLILATWVQSVWKWRPLVSVTGESSAGKTTLFDTLALLFGRLSLLSSKPSEAGLRQAIRNRSVAVMVDEFESDNHRKRILELMRTSGKGSKLLRGTSNQEGTEYGLKHICWVGAVEVGLERQPDRNRFIGLELEKPPADKIGKLDLPSDEALEDLGQRLLVVAVYLARDARHLADRLKRQNFENVHNRVVESFSVPAAMLALCAGMSSEDAAAGLLANVFGGFETDPTQGMSDQHELMNAILESTITISHGEQATVAQILDHPMSYAEGLAAMERIGVAIGHGRRGPRAQESESVLGFGDAVFFSPASIKRYLLRGTKWDDQSVDQIMLRIVSAERKRRRVGGKLVWGIEIAWETLESEFFGCHEESISQVF